MKRIWGYRDRAALFGCALFVVAISLLAGINLPRHASFVKVGNVHAVLPNMLMGGGWAGKNISVTHFSEDVHTGISILQTKQFFLRDEQVIRCGTIPRNCEMFESKPVDTSRVWLFSAPTPFHLSIERSRITFVGPSLMQIEEGVPIRGNDPGRMEVNREKGGHSLQRINPSGFLRGLSEPMKLTAGDAGTDAENNESSDFNTRFSPIPECFLLLLGALLAEWGHLRIVAAKRDWWIGLLAIYLGAIIISIGAVMLYTFFTH